MPDELIKQLITRCTSVGLRFGSFSAYNGEFIITAHDPKLAGRKPLLEEKRDALDWQLDMDAWKRRGMRFLAHDKDPVKVFELAIEYLEQN